VGGGGLGGGVWGGSRSDPHAKLGWGRIGFYQGIPSGKYIISQLLEYTHIIII